MQRPLTFRMWDVNTKRFYYLYLDELIGLTRTITIPKEATIQQYTGLKDKNGVDICEGDIVKDTWKENQPYSYNPDKEYDREEIFEVKYKDYSFNLDRKYNREQTSIEEFHREVIGNIFELPCSKPNSFDHNGECLTCDGWATDCPFINARELNPAN